MEIEIISDTLDILQYSTQIPQTHNQYLLNGATPIYATGDYGSLLFQHISTAENNIWFSSYFISRKAAFKSFGNMPFLELHFTFKNNLQYTIEGIGDFEMGASRFNLTYLPFLESKTYLNPGDFQTFDVHITQEFLLKAALHFPRIETFLNLTDKRTATRLSNINLCTSPAMLLIIRQIKTCQLKGNMREFYIDRKVTELLILVLDMVINDTVSKEIKLRSYYIECLHHAQSLILDNMDDPYTLAELARKTGMNDFKLKKGYKQLFGMSVFNWLFNARMEKSLVLLQETELSIAEIAYTIGYKNIAAFSGAFRKKFGYPPSCIRNKGINK